MQELLHRIQFHDDEFAFNEFYRREIVALHPFVYSFLEDKEGCQEILNDVFLKVWTNRRQMDKIKDIKGYLHVAIKNACLNHNRHFSCQKSRELYFSESFYFELAIDPTQALIGKELQRDIAIAVNKLPPRCKVIFKMVKEDGLSCKEVAEILELSQKTVFAQLAIALKKLESLIT
ncbi:MAG: RNA polymerase sigma-70 factor [Bacteroidota bacterium]|nr:RNA polymerase sigma-70 factor [Bacteroidota bacterium]